MTTLLVVDDVEANRYLLEAMFRGHGFEVVSASNGEEALARALASPPDLIISDILMPVLDGFELCRRWKASERLRGIPFVFYTATYTDPRDEQFALSLGAERFVVKPQQPAVLLEVVNEVLRAALPVPAPEPAADERDTLRQYNEALFRKLEQKVAQLQAEIAERRLAEEALRTSETQIRSILDHLQDAYLQGDLGGRLTLVNPAAVRLYGYGSAAEMIGLPVASLYADPEERAEVLDLVRTVGSVHDRICQGRRRDGTAFWVSLSAQPTRDADGTVRGTEGIIRDIGERRRADEERARLEAQLRQAQKMEAIGRLAGGVAHDFNNLLAVVLSYSDLVLEALREGDPVREDVEEIRKAGERGSALTRQLLAFGRKQVLAPRVLDVDQVVGGLEKLLRRIIGEDLELDLRLRSGTGRVKADPHQLEQVIMNLVVNARDAMPQGGRLTLETSSVDLGPGLLPSYPGLPEGRYVRLDVTDTGCGMDRSTLDHLFEPFFTTKEQGKGTGLGLSTAHGIITQSGGLLAAVSEPGRGSTFTVVLPQVGDALTLEAAERAPKPGGKGVETVLVVEDEEALRRVSTRILRAAGYQVLSAANGVEALDLSARYPGEVHLLLSDVVMPRMGGHELAEHLRRLRPGLRVLFMSGYADPEIVQASARVKGTRFVGKPFAAAELTRRVRESLDAP